MNRLVSLGLILTVLMVLLLGRCHDNNATVHLAMSSYGVISTVLNVRTQIDHYYYEYQELPDSNAAIRQPEPNEFSRKAPQLQRLEVLPGGKLFVQLTAQHEGQPIEFTYTPTIDDNYRLSWTCSSYNLTQHWHQLLPGLCSDAAAPVDLTEVSQQAEQQAAADHYLEQLSSEQRGIEQARPTFDCSVIQQASSDFLYINGDQVEYWELGAQPQRLFSFPRPELAHQTAHWALAGNAYLYVNNRLQVFSQAQPDGSSTQINLLNPYRFQPAGTTLLANSGVGLTRIDLCQPTPKVKDNYLLELGAFNQIEDFLIIDNLMFLSALEAHRGNTYSALQIVSLKSNRSIGFLKLEGNSGGIAINGRLAYVANGSHGIAVVDIYDLTVPRLLSRVSTMDYASDLLILDDHLIVADRLAGLKVFQIQGESLHLTQALPTVQAAIQIKPLQPPYFSISFKNGSSALYQWYNNKVITVELDPQ